MDAVILAGGLGSRLKEVVSELPKPLAPIHDKPFLDILLAQLDASEMVSKVILAVGYRADQVVSYYKNRPNITFSIEASPLGTGGALKKALDGVSSEDLLVCNGDSFLEYSLAEMWQSYRAANADFLMACREVEEASRYGQVDFDGESGRILGFQEKSTEKLKGWINGGVYLMKRDLLRDFPSDHPFSLEQELFPKLLKKRMFRYPVSGLFIDIGTKESYFQAQEILKGVYAEER